VDLTDDQWAVLAPLLPKPRRRPDGRGRPWRDRRDVLNGILWILKTGAPWPDLPRRYPPYQTCHRRYQAWIRAGVLDRVLYALAEDCRSKSCRNGVAWLAAYVSQRWILGKRGR